MSMKISHFVQESGVCEVLNQHLSTFLCLLICLLGLRLTVIVYTKKAGTAFLNFFCVYFFCISKTGFADKLEIFNTN